MKLLDHVRIHRAPHTRARLGQDAFTVVELMIATAVFSIVLLVLATSLIQIGRMYNKGVVSTRTQEAARAIVDDVGQAIQFGSGHIIETPTAASPINVACFGNRRYSYRLAEQPNNGEYRMVADTAKGGCAGGAGGTQPRSSGQMTAPNLTMPTADLRYAGGEELLGPNMRLASFEVRQQPTTGLYDVVVKVVYGDDADLNDPTLSSANCKNERASSQFCAVSEIRTTVQRRIQ